MNDEGLNLDIIDIISVMSFIIGVKNYDENVSQSTMDKTVQSAVRDIHNHLEAQDMRIDKIIELLEVNKNDG